MISNGYFDKYIKRSYYVNEANIYASFKISKSLFIFFSFYACSTFPLPPAV